MPTEANYYGHGKPMNNNNRINRYLRNGVGRNTDYNKRAQQLNLLYGPVKVLHLSPRELRERRERIAQQQFVKDSPSFE